jgi:hypothetical protein
MMRYVVHMRSKPGMYEQYRGVVEVNAPDAAAAIEAAFRKLKRGAFPDRTRDMWIVEDVEAPARLT